MQGFILIGLFKRLAAIPTLIIMMVAIIATRIPVLLGHGLGPSGVRDLPVYGFLSIAHEIRTDWAMLLASLALIIAGGGPWALDRRFAMSDSSAPHPLTSNRHEPTAHTAGP